MRIAIGGFLHESHSFAPLPTGWRDFAEPGGWPAPMRPATLLDGLRNTGVPAAGAIAAAERSGIAIAPLSWAFANPAGPVTAEAFERVAAWIVADLSDALAAGPLDGILLDLHGAMVAEGFPDAEGELLRRVRAVAGPDMPIACSLDPHCNLTAEMVERSDAVSPFRTYPHVDMKQAGARALRLLVERARRGRPFARAFRQADFLLPITSQCTLVPPMSEVFAERERIATRHGVSELAFCFGFPYADFPGCGMAVAAYAADQPAADAAADEFLALLNARERDFQGEILPADRAVAEALKAKPGRPVILADTQDNPGGGGHGDTTGLLAELIRQKAAKAVLGSINDPLSAAACHKAGEGATLSLSLGGRSDGAPLEVTARVLRLSNGRFTCTGAMAGGNPADLGPSALVSVGGVRVIVTSRKMQAYDLALFRHLGVEPAQEGIVAVKSSVHFRADFGPIAGRVLVVAAPGPVVADPATLPFRNLRPGLRLRPGANQATG
ncbi:M81 family peptidase [Roseomonas nepalensis]|uniref:Microcystinase C n=1 Tax=Muricoccus nepalensis TaxID=1854500 RepID=A0A502GGK7_9PROT|nr:M81 family metallopeptidase [Roseomonas nepalensis]TPG61025.1 M81 family peptidase [Roseomonas nepalensis]